MTRVFSFQWVNFRCIYIRHHHHRHEHCNREARVETAWRANSQCGTRCPTRGENSQGTGEDRRPRENLPASVARVRLWQRSSPPSWGVLTGFVAWQRTPDLHMVRELSFLNTLRDVRVRCRFYKSTFGCLVKPLPLFKCSVCISIWKRTSSWYAETHTKYLALINEWPFIQL